MNVVKKFFKKNKKWAIILAIIGVFYAIFNLNTSVSKTAIKEVKQSASKEQVQSVWEKYISEISSKNGQEKLINAVKEKLSQMDLSEEEITNWHKQFRVFSEVEPILNLIIVPDLSYRIIQIPHSEQYDKDIIASIYEEFFKKARKNSSQDKLTIEVTDEEQGAGSFRELASDLSVDLTDRDKKRALDYLKEKEEKLKQNLDTLYKQALKKPRGADYVYYFRRILPERIKKTDIQNEYVNKIIILTDGYLEAQRKTYTHIDRKLKEKVLQGDDLSGMIAYPLPSMNYKLSNTEVLILEITERKDGLGWHKEILNEYWKDWFQRMGMKNVTNNDFFKMHNDNINETRDVIKNFLK